MIGLVKIATVSACLATLVLVSGCSTTQKTSKIEMPRETSETPRQSEESASAKNQQTQSAGSSASQPQSTKGRETASNSPQTERSTPPQTASAATPTPEAELEKAREDVRVSQATHDRVAAELQQLKASGNATPEVVQEYETYLNRVEAMANENREILQRMQSAYERRNQASASQAEPSAQRPSDTTIPEQGMQTEVAALDRQLDESLAAFDEKLLNEMESIRTSSAGKMRSLAEEAAAASKRIQEKSAASEESSQAASGSQTAEGSEKAKQTGEQSTETGETTTVSGNDRQDRSQAGMKQSLPSSERRSEEVSTQDDDIVARQLREAAEKESDPVLKAKLWKEYEDYKKSRRE
jgi:hypothetical protein